MKKSKHEHSKSVALCLFLGAIIILISMLYINFKINNALTILLLAIVTVISGSLFTASFSMLSFKHSGLLEYVQTQAENTLINAEYINNLSLEKLEQMRTTLNAKLYNADVASDDNSLLNYIANSLEPLLYEYYFEKYEVEIDLKLKSIGYATPFIEKTITKEMFAKPMQQHTQSKIALSEILKGKISSSQIASLDSIEIIELKINNKIISSEIEFSENNIADETYPIKYQLNLLGDTINPIPIEKDGCKIKIKFVTRVTLDDLVSFNKVAIPCKTFSMRINYDESQFSLKESQYIFIDKETRETSIEVDHAHRCTKIKCTKWILPGNGIALYLPLKNDPRSVS